MRCAASTARPVTVSHWVARLVAASSAARIAARRTSVALL
jgi:hypothetical protein